MTYEYGCHNILPFFKEDGGWERGIELLLFLVLVLVFFSLVGFILYVNLFIHLLAYSFWSRERRVECEE